MPVAPTNLTTEVFMKYSRGKTATAGMYAWTKRQRHMRKVARRMLRKDKHCLKGE